MLRYNNDNYKPTKKSIIMIKLMDISLDDKIHQRL